MTVRLRHAYLTGETEGGWLQGTVRVTQKIQGVAESNFFAKEKIGDDTNTHVRLPFSLYIYF